MKDKFSARATRKAKMSRKRTQRMLKEASSRSGPVTVSYLPGFEPPAPKTKFPFKARINGWKVTVWPTRIEWPEQPVYLGASKSFFDGLKEDTDDADYYGGVYTGDL